MVWLRNTAYLVIEKAGYLAKYAAASLQTEASNFLLENVNMLFITKNKYRYFFVRIVFVKIYFSPKKVCFW